MSEPHTERRDGSRLLAIALLLGAVVIALVAAAALLTGAPRAPQHAPPNAAAPGAPPGADAVAMSRGGESAGATAQRANDGARPGPAVAVTDSGEVASGPAAAALAAALSNADEDILDDTARGSRFELAVTELAAQWPLLDNESLRAALDACVARAASPHGPDLVRALSPSLLRLGAAHTSPLAAHEVAPAAFAAGALWRFALDPRSSRALSDRSHAALAGAGFPAPVGEAAVAFDAGASGALLRLPGAILGADTASGSAGDAGAWRQWLVCVRRLADADPGARDSLLAHGAERLLGAASARKPDQTTRALLLEVIGAGDWSRDGSPLRVAALRWLEDPSISSRELAPATQWVASSPGARDAGADAVISPDASPDARARARDRLASVWRLATPAALDAVRLRWREEAKRAIDLPARSASAVDRLSRAAKLARLCAGAALVHRADAAGARAILTDLEGPVRDAADAPSRAAIHLTEPAPPDDGAWALRFLGARRSAADRRVAMLEMASRTGALGPVDAEALVEAALYSSPSDVRLGAYRAVERRASDTTIANALLEQLPRAPRSEAFSSLVARASGRRLPPPRDPRWPVDARRALVAKLLTDLTGSTSLAALDRLAAVIADAHLDWADDSRTRSTSAASPADAQRPARPDAADPAFAVRAVADLLRREARSSPAWTGAALRDASLGGLDRRRAAWGALAEGPVQSFEAGALGAVDLLSLLVELERPAHADAARLLVDRLRALRRASTDSYEALGAIHETLARLWSLRLGDTM